MNERGPICVSENVHIRVLLESSDNEDFNRDKQ